MLEACTSHRIQSLNNFVTELLWVLLQYQHWGWNRPSLLASLPLHKFLEALLKLQSNYQEKGPEAWKYPLNQVSQNMERSYGHDQVRSLNINILFYQTYLWSNKDLHYFKHMNFNKESQLCFYLQFKDLQEFKAWSFWRYQVY